MKTLRTCRETTLSWVQPKTMERRHELRHGDFLYAVLDFRSALGTLAVVESADGAWSFKRVGFMHPRVSIRVAGSERDVAEFQPKAFGGGIVTFPDGGTCLWKSANFWSTKWCLTDGDSPFLEFTDGLAGGKLSDIFKTQAMMTMHRSTRFSTSLPMLAGLGMYLLLLQAEDGAGAVVVTS
ncbi:MAG: hypothetical protein IPP94_16575 [Ignavibacteria bacterium]|nr:hypothetical protein [Ignavibacteria bacterium]